MADPARICKRCGSENEPVLINGECCGCYDPRRCKACDEGRLHSKPTPEWMNRWVCNKCGDQVGR